MAAKRYLISCYDMDDGDGGGVHTCTFPVCLLVFRGLFTCIKKGLSVCFITVRYIIDDVHKHSSLDRNCIGGHIHARISAYPHSKHMVLVRNALPYFGSVSTRFLIALSSAPSTTHNQPAPQNQFTGNNSPALPLFQSTSNGLRTLSLTFSPPSSSAFMASRSDVAPFIISPTRFLPANSRMDRSCDGVGTAGALTTSSSKTAFLPGSSAALVEASFRRSRTRLDGADLGAWKSVRTSRVLCCRSKC